MKEVWIPPLNYQRFWRFYFSVYSLAFVSIEKIYQTLETVFHRLSKHFEFRQKYSAVRRIFNSLLGVRISRWDTACPVWYTCTLKQHTNLEIPSISTARISQGEKDPPTVRYFISVAPRAPFSADLFLLRNSWSANHCKRQTKFRITYNALANSSSATNHM